MPKFAVMLRYELVSGLVIDAENADEADRIATEFEAAIHDRVEDAEGIGVEVRIWGGNGTIDVEEVDDEEAAGELLDEWLDEIDFGDEDDDDDYDEDEDEDDDEKRSRFQRATDPAGLSRMVEKLGGDSPVKGLDWGTLTLLAFLIAAVLLVLVSKLT